MVAGLRATVALSGMHVPSNVVGTIRSGQACAGQAMMSRHVLHANLVCPSTRHTSKGYVILPSQSPYTVLYLHRHGLLFILVGESTFEG